MAGGRASTGEESSKTWMKVPIGLSMLVAEQSMGGYALEGLKIRRQALGLSYRRLVGAIYAKEGLRGFYHGYYPWALLQCTQGLPMLYVQQTTVDLLTEQGEAPSAATSLLSGVLGGCSMAAIVTPTNRLKTIAMTDPSFLGLNASRVASETVARHGLAGLYYGFVPVCSRKACDWGIRYVVRGPIERQFERVSGVAKQDFTFAMHFGVGLSCGAVSTVTTPFDTLISQTQKYRAEKGRARMSVVAAELWREGGVRSFYRGLSMRMVHASYHSAWVMGGGQWVYDRLAK